MTESITTLYVAASWDGGGHYAQRIETDAAGAFTAIYFQIGQCNRTEADRAECYRSACIPEFGECYRCALTDLGETDAPDWFDDFTLDTFPDFPAMSSSVDHDQLAVVTTPGRVRLYAVGKLGENIAATAPF